MGAKMRSSWLKALAVAVLLVPGLGKANPGPYRWVMPFQDIAQLGAGSTISYVNNDDVVVDLDFEIQLYGQTFNKVRVGKKGYVTLGYDGPNGPAVNPATATANPSPLDSGSQPGNLIAVWWGNHYCEPDQTAKIGTRWFKGGTAPNRRFVVEWACAVSAQSDVKFQAQLHILENSGIIRFHYGDLATAPDDPSDWTTVRAGLKNGNGSQFSYALYECPASGCKRAHYPKSGTVIQYGVRSSEPVYSNKPDVLAWIDRNSVQHGLEIDPTTGDAIAWVQLSGEVRNISEIATKDRVSYQIYFSDSPRVYNGNGQLRLKEAENVALGGGQILLGHPDPQSVMEITADDPTTLPVETRFEVPRNQLPVFGPYLCVEAIVGIGNLGDEELKHNNVDCYPEPLYFGPRLSVVSISGQPATAIPMDEFNIRLAIRNDGQMTATTEPFPINVELFLAPLSDPYNSNGWVYLAHPTAKQIFSDVAAPGLPPFKVAGGEFVEAIPAGETREQVFRVMIPFDSDISEPEWVLGAKIRYANNAVQPIPVFISAPGVSSNVMKILLSELVLQDEEFSVEMPLGCVQTTPTRSWATICNEGEGPAMALRIEYAFGRDGSTAARGESGFTQSFPPDCSNTVWDEASQMWVDVWDSSLCPNPGDICSRATCQTPCDPNDSKPNNGCPDGTRCIRSPYMMLVGADTEYACSVYLEPGECRTFSIAGTIPSESREVFNPTDPENPRENFGDPSLLEPTIIPNAHSAPSLNPQDFWTLPDPDTGSAQLVCPKLRADLVAEEFKVPLPVLEVIPGTPFQVERRIRNVGPLSTSYEYGYFISSVPYISPLQIPVPVFGTVDDLGRSWIAPKVVRLEDPAWPTTDGIDHRLDLVFVPQGTPPGEYYFGLVVDPSDKIVELDEINNVYIYPLKLIVLEPDLVIETANLPPATVGVRYNHTLWASGGSGGHKWEKVSGFPAWLDLDPETGHLSGIPDEARDYVLTVQVRSGALLARRTYSLRVLAPEGALSIPRHSLPPAFWGVPFGPIELKANGGKPPYTWTSRALDGNGRGLPPGFCLTPDGLLATMQPPCPDTPGTMNPIVEVPRAVNPGAYRFLVEVTDQRGATAVEELTIFVTGDRAIRIEPETLRAGQVGVAYNPPECVVANGPANAVYEWSVTGLPRGLEYFVEGNGVCIHGMPLEFGVFMVNVTATYEGMRASRLYALTILNPNVYLLRSHLGTFPQGAAVDERIEASEQQVTVTILQGRLPSGLVLEGGLDGYWVRGTISQNAEPGNYSLLLELRTPTGRVGLAGLGITVAKAEKKAPPAESDSGCSSAAGSPASGGGFAVAMLGLLGMIRSRRNRSEEAN